MAVKSLDKTLSQIHDMLAVGVTFLGFPQYAEALKLDEDDSAKMAEALAEFAKHHNMPALTNKRASEVQLLMAIGSIYGRKVAAVAFTPKPAPAPVADVSGGAADFGQPMPNPATQAQNWFGLVN